MRKWRSWSKDEFLEWLRDQGSPSADYVEEFDNALMGSKVDIRAIAKDSVLESLIWIEDADDRAEILSCLKDLKSLQPVSGKSGGI